MMFDRIEKVVRFLPNGTASGRRSEDNETLRRIFDTCVSSKLSVLRNVKQR
jgi:hypothetical protein